MSWWSHRDRLALVAAVGLPLGVAALLVPFRDSLPNTDAALVLVVVIVAVAAAGHRVGGLLAAASAAVWFDFFLTAPYERFTITHRTDIETTVLLLLVGSAVTELAVRGRRHRAIAVADAAYLAAIGATSELVASGAAAQPVIDQVTVQLSGLLGLRGCRYEYVPIGGDLPRLDPDGRVSYEDGFWDLDQFGMPGISVQIPAGALSSRGRFVLDPVAGTLAPLPARRAAVILARYAGLALARQAEPATAPSRVLGRVRGTGIN